MDRALPLACVISLLRAGETPPPTCRVASQWGALRLKTIPAQRVRKAVRSEVESHTCMQLRALEGILAVVQGQNIGLKAGEMKGSNLPFFPTFSPQLRLCWGGAASWW